jgi:hypothetical protein
MLRRRNLWLLNPSQWWRWRHWRLWRGGRFDPRDSQQIAAYAVMRLRGEAREGFLLNCIHAQDYALIGHHLGLSDQEVEAHMAAALCQITHSIDLIERVGKAPLSPDRPDALFGRRYTVADPTAAS